MAIQPERHLSLELTQATTPIRGRLRDGHGHVWTFSSWLGLLAALNHAIPSADSPQTGNSRNTPSIGGAASDADVLDAPLDG